jgi:hypothetical protein
VPGHESEEPTLWQLVTERTAQACPARCASNAAERLRNGIKRAARLKLEAELAAQDTYCVPADSVDPVGALLDEVAQASAHVAWLGLRNAGRARLVKRGQPLAA